MPSRSLATRIVAPAAACLLLVGLSGCGSEVEGTATNQPSTSAQSSQKPSNTKSDGSSSTRRAHRNRTGLKVVEDLGLNRRLGSPEKRISRCTVPMQKKLPRGKAAAVFKSSRGGLLIKYVLAGQLDSSKLSLFTFATNSGKNQRLVGLQNGVVARNSATVGEASDAKLKGEYQYRGWTKVEPTPDGMILWVEIPQEIAPAFQMQTWTGSLTVDGEIISSCAIG